MKIGKLSVVALSVLMCLMVTTGCSRFLRDGVSIGVTDGLSDGLSTLVADLIGSAGGSGG